MSKLLLLGYNPAKSYLENGADLILENGLRIEVKSGRRCQQKRTLAYVWNIGVGHKPKRPMKIDFDFVICWCIDDDCFFIIPKKVLTSNTIGIYDIGDNSKSKFRQYKNNWELLEG